MPELRAVRHAELPLHPRHARSGWSGSGGRSSSTTSRPIPTRCERLTRARRRQRDRAGAGRRRRGRAGRLAGRGCVGRPRVGGDVTTRPCTVRVRGVVQGVGFRPFVFRLARAHTLDRLGAQRRRAASRSTSRAPERSLDAFLRELRDASAARRDHRVARRRTPRRSTGFGDFTIRASRGATGRPCASRRIWRCATTASASCSIPPTRAPAIRTSTAPTAARATRSSKACPTTAAQTTMRAWALYAACDAAVSRSRRPAIPRPAGRVPDVRTAVLRCAAPTGSPRRSDGVDPIRAAAALIAQGRIVAVKGLGGYHLACDASQCRRGAAAARAEVPEGAAVRAHGPGSRRRADARSHLSDGGDRAARSRSRARSSSAPAAMPLAERRAGQSTSSA